MKLFFFLLFLITSLAQAQVRDVVEGKYTPGFFSEVNYVKNPNCFANTRGISTSGSAAVSRNTTDPLNGFADCAISGTSSGDKVVFGMAPFHKGLKGQTCETKFTYSGSASKWKVYAERSGVSVGEVGQLTDTTDSVTVSLQYLCGDLSATTTIVVEATDATPLPIKVFLYSGKIINGASACADSYECEDTFNAKVDGVGTAYAENLDWINGNCTVTSGLFSCPLKAGLAGNGKNLTGALNCNITATDSDNGNVVSSKIIASSTTTISWVNAFNSTKINTQAHVVCHKHSSDYLTKTAKAVASDQSVRAIGSLNVDTQIVRFGTGTNCESVCTTGTCTICHQVGTKISSVTLDVTGRYKVNGIDGTKYNCSGNGISSSSAGASIAPVASLSTGTYASIQHNNSSGVATNVGFALVTCTAKDQ